MFLPPLLLSYNRHENSAVCSWTLHLATQYRIHLSSLRYCFIYLRFHQILRWVFNIIFPLTSNLNVNVPRPAGVNLTSKHAKLAKISLLCFAFSANFAVFHFEPFPPTGSWT